jgi:hypothetical protein
MDMYGKVKNKRGNTMHFLILLMFFPKWLNNPRDWKTGRNLPGMGRKKKY